VTQQRDRSKVRVAFVNTHPIQYFAPLYRYINATSNIEAVPIYLSDISLRGEIDKGFGHAVKWDVDLLSGMKPVFAKGAGTRMVETGVTKMMVPEIWSLIRKGGYDAVVAHGHATGANHIAWAAAKTKGIPVFTRGETHLGLVRTSFRASLRKWLMPLYYSTFDGVLAIGSANKRFYEANKVRAGKISPFPYSVDNDQLITLAHMTTEERHARRSKLGLSKGRLAILFASKFQPRKHPEHLIEACAQLAKDGLEFDLVLAGSGEMDVQLRSLAEQHPQLNVKFPGFFNQSELPSLMAACDVFVLPSRNEPWGLIINEAMCAGLPVIASREIGSVEDLIEDGINGYVFDAGDIPALTKAIRSLLENPDKCHAMGHASVERIKRWGYQECLDGLTHALGNAGILVPPKA
jgi:glycosyltransferase involved in cell wall biosynthesis